LEGEEEVVEEGTPSASALPLLFLEVFHQPAALPAFVHVRAQELMASERLVANLPQKHTVVLAQSPAPQRRKNMMSSGRTLARGQSPATCPKIFWFSRKRSLEKGARPKTIGFTEQVCDL